MRAYNPTMTYGVEFENEGGLHLIRFSAHPYHHAEEVYAPDGVVCGVVHVDSDGVPVDVEIFSLPDFDLDACAAKYGFSDRAGAIGMALATAAA